MTNSLSGQSSSLKAAASLTAVARASSRVLPGFVFGNGLFSKAQCASDLSSTTAAILAPVPEWNYSQRLAWQRLGNGYRSCKYRLGIDNPSSMRRKRIVFLGTGWSAMKFLPRIDTSKYEVIVVSPRSHFTFTPLLPSVCAGALSVRSCMESIRRFTRRGGRKVIKYYEGTAEDVDFDQDRVRIAHRNGQRFDVSYDALIVGVGSEAATFGIPGVAENAYFLKEAENAMAIRQRVLSNFETANLPATDDAEQRRLLHFVCVGGGPSGVETAAELADFVKEDVAAYFPHLSSKVTISVVEMLPKVLPAFNDAVSKFTIQNFNRMGVNPMLKTRVTRITSNSIEVVKEGNVAESLPCGFVLWASGIGQTPFARKVMAKIPQQQKNRPAVINVDQNLRIKGVPHHNVFALGDCAFVKPAQLQDHAKELYAAASKSAKGAGIEFLKSSATLKYRFPQLHPSKCHVKDDRNNLTEEQFKALLAECDQGYKPPVPTAQNAGQEGQWLASVLNDFDLRSDKNRLPCFVESFRGALAYVGHGESVALTPWFSIIGGFHSTIFWRSCYWAMQLSIQNKFMLAGDWMRLRIVGRDLSLTRTKDCSSVGPPKAYEPVKLVTSETTKK